MCSSQTNGKPLLENLNAAMSYHRFLIVPVVFVWVVNGLDRSVLHVGFWEDLRSG